MNVMYVRTSGNQPSKAHVCETLLQNTERGEGADSNNTFSYKGACKYLLQLISSGFSSKFSSCKRSWNRIINTFWEFTLFTRGI